jgi:ferritin-like metal-binding protein YciE
MCPEPTARREVALTDIFNNKGAMKTRSGKTQTSSRSTSKNGQGETSGRNAAGENHFHELFLEELSDVYSAEQQITKALPKMAKAAESDELRQAFEQHLQETEGQIARLDEVFESLGESRKRKTCKAMEGLIEEGSEMMEEQKGKPSVDAALIAAAQKVEHYEIASYGTLCAWAEQLGHTDALQLLKQNIEEEETTDKRLTELAESLANQRAEQG